MSLELHSKLLNDEVLCNICFKISKIMVRLTLQLKTFSSKRTSIEWDFILLSCLEINIFHP